MRRGLFQVKTPSSKARARLFRVTCADHFFLAFFAIGSQSLACPRRKQRKC
jgi:hypothetical protein